MVECRLLGSTVHRRVSAVYFLLLIVCDFLPKCVVVVVAVVVVSVVEVPGMC